VHWRDHAKGKECATILKKSACLSRRTGIHPCCWGGIITIRDETHSGPKSLADILAEELDGELGAEHTQELSVAKKQKRLKAVYERIHKEQPTRSALCLSGGGIRSAIFGLGILQGLAKHDLLRSFDYLSTVSGGGYVGGWLTAWIYHSGGVNDSGGVKAVAKELKRDPESPLNPEPEPIRNLRKFSNYLTPKTGLTSADTWTLIATFIRNVFLNWLVLISCLAAAMMIPRLYLAAINVEPDWSTWRPPVAHRWDIGLTILLAVGFALIAIAMAYAIIDVPSTGNARWPQSRFLKFRQLPLLLASLILAEWWALFRNVHGSELFRPRDWLLKFVAFTVASYLSGGFLATAILSFRKREQKARRGGLTILVTAAFAGFCLWAMATRMFLDEPKKIQFIRDCDGTKIPSEQNVTVKGGTEGTIEKIVDGSYIIQTDQGPARITGKGLKVVERDPTTNLATKFRAKRDCEAIQIQTGQKTKVAAGTEGSITKTTEEASYTLNTNQGQVRITKEHFDALKPKESRFTLARACNATRIPSGEKISLPIGTTGNIKRIDETGYTVENGQGEQFRIARNRIDAFDLKAVPAPANHALNYVCFAPALILAVLLLVNFLFTGLASRVTADEDREWWARSAAWILITIFGWIVFNGMDLWGAQAITAAKGNELQVFLGQPEANPVAKAILGAFGGVTGIAGALLALRHKLSNKLGQKRGFQWLLVVVAVVFFVLLSIVSSWVLVLIRSRSWMQSAVKWFYHESPLSSLPLPAWRVEFFVAFFLSTVLVLFGIVMGFFIDANKFSLHATYRNRLIRAFLGASRKRETRNAHLFTGFDPHDNIELFKLKPDKPFHLVNATLNLIKGKDLAWQERKAESFTMSRLHCGSWHVGYRSSREYGKGKRKAITLGTALAISGAAANPNMGYHSSPVVGFMMTLFNLRLGWWLGNPGPAGDKTWRRAGPGFAVGPLFSEALGTTTDRSKYVNLSDGGHFENLGLYEMVLRRCKLILVVDAGQDFKYIFEDLGNAIRKIRIDLGIPIDIRVAPPKKSEGTVNHCAFGTIKYSAVDGPGTTEGQLIYIKPLVSGDEPPDISNYAAAHPEFPHETTTDQWFSESQFESYRLLGQHAVEAICGKHCPKVLSLFFEQVKSLSTACTPSMR
jgi:preprotein translocase subunit YajC